MYNCRRYAKLGWEFGMPIYDGVNNKSTVKIYDYFCILFYYIIFCLWILRSHQI